MGISVAMPTRFRLQEVLDAHLPPLSQRELAAVSGVSPTTINRMCRNLTAQVSLATLDALSEVLGVEPGALLEREGKRRGKR
jgi:transcriptional regulator with XRE-family HTH domain